MDEPIGTWPQGRFDSRRAWADLLLHMLELAVRDKVRQLVWCDPDFSDWPLGERAFDERLNAWAQAGGHLKLLALDYRPVVQQHARFVRWRTTWSHRVDARQAPRALEEGFPALACHSGWGAQRTATSPPVVLAFTDPARVQGLFAQWQALWERSGAGFAATTLGL